MDLSSLFLIFRYLSIPLDLAPSVKEVAATSQGQSLDRSR